MVLQEIVAFGLEQLAGFVGAHGLKIGALATGLVALYHGREALLFAQSGVQTLRVALYGAAAVGLALIVAVSFGWVAVEQLPSIPLPLKVIAA